MGYVYIQVMANKNTECLKEHEALQNEFNNAMRHTLEQKNIEDMTKQQLEQVQIKAGRVYGRLRTLVISLHTNPKNRILKFCHLPKGVGVIYKS